MDEWVLFGRYWRWDFKHVPVEEERAPECLRALCEAIDFNTAIDCNTAMIDIHGIATSTADDEHCGYSIMPHLMCHTRRSR